MGQGSLAAARIISYGLLLLAAGLPFHAVLDQRRRMSAGERGVLGALTVGAIASSLWWTLANIAAMAAMPLAELDQGTVMAVLGATPLGPLLAARLTLLTILGTLLVVGTRPVLLAIVALPALATVAWAGHAGAGEGISGSLLKASDILHLAAAALWLGALVTFVVTAGRPHAKSEVIRSLAGFARAGTLVVAILFATGVCNLWLVSAEQLPSGTWPLLIGLKFALFLAMLGFAARNRWLLVPELIAGTSGATRRLMLSLALETGCAITIISIVGIAGLLDPHGV